MIFKYALLSGGLQDLMGWSILLSFQILSVLEKLYLLWDVVRKSLGLMIPILAGTTINMMANNCLPSPIAVSNMWLHYIVLGESITYPCTNIVQAMVINLVNDLTGKNTRGPYGPGSVT